MAWVDVTSDTYWTSPTIGGPGDDTTFTWNSGAARWEWQGDGEALDGRLKAALNWLDTGSLGALAGIRVTVDIISPDANGWMYVDTDGGGDYGSTHPPSGYEYTEAMVADGTYTVTFSPTVDSSNLDHLHFISAVAFAGSYERYNITLIEVDTAVPDPCWENYDGTEELLV